MRLPTLQSQELHNCAAFIAYTDLPLNHTAYTALPVVPKSICPYIYHSLKFQCRRQETVREILSARALQIFQVIHTFPARPW